MINKVKEFIKENKLNLNNKVVCAVSGGADSTCLLYVLHKLGYDVILAHVNHHKRKESDMEEEAMRAFAKSLNIPFEVLEYHFSGEGNFHDDSHYARYNFFRSICDKYNTDIIATAHHADDQIETILIKLMEGSNLYGYGGIALCNNDSKYRIFRPFLGVTKEDIYNYAKANNIVYFEDSSNKEDDFLRNRLRHHVIPLLKKECGDLYSKSLRYSILLHESFDYIRNDSINYLNSTNNTINLDMFNSFDVALKKDIIALLFEKNNIRKNTNIIRDVLDLLESNTGSKDMNLEGNHILRKEYDRAYIIKKEITSKSSFKLNIGDVIIFNNKYRFYFSKNVPALGVKYIKLCYNQLELPLTIRSKEDGDFIKLSDGTKKISRVFIDNKVPKALRDSIPVIEDRCGNILWVYNYIKSDSVYKQKEHADIYLICEVENNV